jgi:hypothetical protein
MGKTRVCGKTCHKARREKCRCWCGGIFHGGRGAPAREAFVREFGAQTVPTTEAVFNERTSQPSLFDDFSSGHRWRAAIAAAVMARDEVTHETASVQRNRVSGARAAV